MGRQAAKPYRPPVQERSRHTVACILEAAVQVFEEHGHAAGTTARIAERAGVSVGTLYQYFPNKDAVLAALAEQHVAEAAAMIPPLLARLADGVPLRAGLEQVVRTVVGAHRQNPRLHRLLYEDGLLPTAMRQAVAGMEAALVAQVAGLLDRHSQVRPGQAVLQAWFVVHAVEHFAHKLVIHPPPAGVDPADFEDRGSLELVDLLLRYLVA